MTGSARALDLLLAAIERRRGLIDRSDPRLGCYRLVHGAADGLDGLSVDRYGPALLVEQHRATAEPEPLIAALAEEFGEDLPVVLKRRCTGDEQGRSGSLVRSGSLAPEIVVEEEGLRFAVHLTRGMHTGLFLDTRPARALARQEAAGRRVLNLFAYTGAFGVATAAGGALSTTNVDVKRSALAAARRNYALNRAPSNTRTFLSDDALRFLGRAARGRGRYDLVIIDPPPWFRRPGGRRFDAREGLDRLVARCLDVLAPGGLLLVGLNAPSVDDDTFTRRLIDGATVTGVRLVLRDRVTAGADFPPVDGCPAARFVLCEIV